MAIAAAKPPSPPSSSSSLSSSFSSSSSSSSSTATTATPNKNSFVHLIAGSLGGITAKTVLQPLDLVKVRLQVQDGSSHGEYRGVAHALRSIVAADGVAGLYRGLAPNLLSSGVSWGVYFFVYNRAKEAWRTHIGETTSSSSSSSSTKSSNKKGLSPIAHLLCAATAGACGITATNPIVMVKTRLQLQGTFADHHKPASSASSAAAAAAVSSSSSSSPSSTSLPAKGSFVASGKPYRGTIDCFLRIAREEGILSFYRGLGPALMLVSNGSIQFMFYEEFRRAAATMLGGEQNLGPQVFFVMSGSAKFLATTITYPLSVLRSRTYQRTVNPATGMSVPKYDGVGQIVRHIVSNEGPRGFYRGFLAHLMKTTPSSAITFTTYEMVVKALSAADRVIHSSQP